MEPVRFPRHVRSALLAAFCAIPASACTPSDGSSPGIERSVENGIERVLIRGPDVALGWSFQEEVSIPAEAGGEARFAQASPWEVGADREGRIYVLDRPGGRVVVFGRSGRMVGSVGRPGRGPGELSDPTALAVSPDGELAVYDQAAEGVARWGIAGERALQQLEVPFRGPTLGMAPWGLIYPSAAPDGRDGRVVRLVVAGDTRTGTLAELEPSTVRASLPSCGLEEWLVEPVFEPRLEWALGGDIVVTASGPRYELEIFRRGVLERRIARDVEPRTANRELAIQEVGDGLELTAPVRCRLSPAEVVDARGFAATVPSIAALAVAPDGTIWVRRGTVRGEKRSGIDVFESDGTYLGTLPSGSPYPAAFAGWVTDYRVVSLGRSEGGEEVLTVHRISR